MFGAACNRSNNSCRFHFASMAANHHRSELATDPTAYCHSHIDAALLVTRDEQTLQPTQ